MKVNQFSTSITYKGSGYSCLLLARNALDTKGEILKVAPIPPYFVYGRFEKYLDASLVLERVMSVNSSVNNMFTQLIFLKVLACQHKMQVIVNPIW